MKIDSFRLVLYIMMVEFPFGLLFSAEGQDSAEQCSGSCSIENYWCDISPRGYSMINVTEDQPGRIVCAIPYTTGQDILVVNHLGVEVRTDPILRNYVQQLPMPSADTLQTSNKSYNLEIQWPEDNQIQDRLKIIQCIAIFHGTSQLCKTSMVNVQFKSNQATTSTASASMSTPSIPTTDPGASTSGSESSQTTTKASDSSPTTTTGCTNILIQPTGPAGQSQFHNYCTKTTLSSLALLLSLLIASLV